MVRRLVKQFWGESEQVTFGRKFVVADLPTYLTDVQRSVAGFISFSETEKSLLIVALAVVSQFQNCGIGAALIKKVENEASVMGKEMLLVSSSNDDLAALGFYQKMGFQIFSVKPDIIAEKHGGVMAGIGGLPIRDELRLRKWIV